MFSKMIYFLPTTKIILQIESDLNPFLTENLILDPFFNEKSESDLVCLRLNPLVPWSLYKMVTELSMHTRV